MALYVSVIHFILHTIHVLVSLATIKAACVFSAGGETEWGCRVMGVDVCGQQVQPVVQLTVEESLSALTTLTLTATQLHALVQGNARLHIYTHYSMSILHTVYSYGIYLVNFSLIKEKKSELCWLHQTRIFISANTSICYN